MSPSKSKFWSHSIIFNSLNPLKTSDLESNHIFLSHLLWFVSLIFKHKNTSNLPKSKQGSLLDSFWLTVRKVQFYFSAEQFYDAFLKQYKKLVKTGCNNYRNRDFWPLIWQKFCFRISHIIDVYVTWRTF